MTESETSEIIQAKRYFQNGLYWDEFKSPIKNYARTAVNALEKQIPKKPDIYGDGYDDDGNLIYDTYDCPNCQTSYEIEYEKYDYCPHCGQAIDWSENNV